ncbi:MAG: hypothetical protein ACRDUW_04990 [Pseudonocardiaceae bacterium]
MRAHPLSIPSTAVSAQIDNAGGRVVWWAWRETTGAASATFRLRDGSGSAGQLLVPFSLAANDSTRDYPGLHSIPYDIGLYLEVLTGTVEGVVMVISGRHDEPYGVPVVIIGQLDVQINEGG